MTEFLSGDALSKAIRKVCSGQDVRIASAFWGRDAVKELKLDVEKTKVICDVSMGGTNPEELKKLGAPKNERLRAFPGLHSKVYLSSCGGVVCSANASSNGIGFFSEPSKLVEAGVWLSDGSQGLAQAVKWFDALYEDKKCLIVDKNTLQFARTSWMRRSSGDGHRGGHGSFDLDSAVTEKPELLEGWGFVFNNSSYDQETRERLASANEVSSSEYDFFTDWGSEGGNFPPRFLNIYRAATKIFLKAFMTVGVGRTVEGIDDVVLVKKTEIREFFPSGTKSNTESAGMKNFEKILDKLNPGEGKIFANAEHLAEELLAVKKPRAKH